MDTAGWADVHGFTCADYARFAVAVCPSGVPTSGRLPLDDAGTDATSHCCACGGGRMPPSLPPPQMPPSLPVAIFHTKSELSAAIANLAAEEALRGPVNGWDVSRITDLSSLFYFMTWFNKDVDDWDTSSVTSLENTFSVRARTAPSPALLPARQLTPSRRALCRLPAALTNPCGGTSHA